MESGTVLFDTDILIWIERGNKAAAKLVNNCSDRFLSLQSYMELLQCAQNKEQHKQTKSFLKSTGFIVLPITENIGHRAAIYIEQYALSHGMRAGDAIVCATAMEHGHALCTSNVKHYQCIQDLDLIALNLKK